MTTPFLPTLLDDASRPFRASGHFAYHYARGKLSSDCIFRELLKRGVFPAEARFLDLGCGQGSLFSWLLAARALYEKGVWPGDWAAAPKPLSLRGYELMARDVERAALAFGRPHPIVDIRQGDMREVDFGAADVVTILDALHYLPHADQDAGHRPYPQGAAIRWPVPDACRGCRRRSALPHLQLGRSRGHLRARPSPAKTLWPQAHRMGRPAREPGLCRPQPTDE
jgi:SAM-dependent methyltransferase